ncbi:upstream stimulatory factor 2-like [Halichondria panicea]|uniref:upstream stimulatory factor 2-like n=1 Tax=Halichondria panicea TaxID=6063 RepID=UPI00312B39DB
MIPPSSSAEILHAMGRPIAPKMSGISTMDYHTADPIVQMQLSGDMAANREAQRKATYNEVERRRRDRINEFIKVLAQIVPACQKIDATTGSIVRYVYSKGTVLDKTVDYLKELVFQNKQLTASAKIAEKSTNALAMNQNQIQVLEKENAFLRAQIIQFRIDAAASSGQKQPNQQLLNSPLAQSLLNTVVTHSPRPLLSPLHNSPHNKLTM